MAKKEAKKVEGSYEWWKEPSERDWEKEQWVRHTGKIRAENVTGRTTKSGLVITRSPPKRRKWPWAGLFSKRRRIGKG